MSRTYWTTQTEDSASVWTNESTIPRPNENFPLGVSSNLIQRMLNDGSLSYILPETKFNYANLQFIWYSDTGGIIKTQIENYVKNATRLKLIDHNAVEYVGRFIQVTPVWITGIADEYDISAIFLRENV